MKQFYIVILMCFLVSCQSNKKMATENPEKMTSDTIRIANEELEYEVVIIDAGFTSWYNAYAKPRGYYSQSYLESRNRIWVTEWNARSRNPQYSDLYQLPIDYQFDINYGYEVNYMLYYYLVYFQLTNKQQLGGFTARI
ncbi:DUF6146 family protein [Flavobacterium urocaniciphilum]|nr:DUF6146 family protein [Flavobacterium urocaniciphilum]